jgi:hypothetical protein
MYVKTLHCIYTPTNPNIGSIYACGGRTRAIAAGSTAVCSERHRLLEIETESDGIIFSLLRQQTLSPQR